MPTPLQQYLQDVPLGVGFAWRYADVNDLAQQITWSWEECVRQARLTEADAGDMLTPNGVLVVCLLWLDPFRTPKDTQIADVRSEPPQYYECRNRPLLLGNLANLLHQYDRKRSYLVSKYPLTSGKLAEAIVTLEVAVDEFLALRRLRLVPTSPPLANLHEKTLRKALQTLTPLARWLESPETREQYYPALHPLYQRLICVMNKAFQTYGPPDYPRAANYGTMAVILQAFRLEHGDLADITDRVKQRVSRAHPKPPVV